MKAPEYKDYDVIDWRTLPPWGIALAFVFEAGLNYLGGYEMMGGAEGGAKANAIAWGCVLLAALCAWAGKSAVPMWRDQGTRPIAYVLFAVALLGFYVSQTTAHRVLGVTFADGALRREIAGDSLGSLRAELAKLGITRPLTAIENDINLELRKTSRQFPNGDGPAALKLKNEQAVALRKLEIEKKVADAQSKGKAVRAGAENMINERLGISPDGSLLLLILAITALMGFFANFGFMLLAAIAGARLRETVPPPAMFDPQMLPPPMRPSRYVALPPPGATDVAAAGPGGGSTNIIHVGGSGQIQRLPPRIAARRG